MPQAAAVRPGLLPARLRPARHNRTVRIIYVPTADAVYIHLTSDPLAPGRTTLQAHAARHRWVRRAGLERRPPRRHRDPRRQHPPPPRPPRPSRNQRLKRQPLDREEPICLATGRPWRRSTLTERSGTPQRRGDGRSGSSRSNYRLAVSLTVRERRECHSRVSAVQHSSDLHRLQPQSDP